MKDFHTLFNTKNNQIHFHPSNKKDADFIFLQLKAEWGFLQNKLNDAKDTLDTLPEDNVLIKAQEVGTLIFVNKALQSIQSQFKAVKIWFKKNNFNHPVVPKTLRLRKERSQLINEYIINLRDKIEKDDVPFNRNKSALT